MLLRFPPVCRGLWAARTNLGPRRSIRVRLRHDTRGAGTTEYIILLGALALVAVGVVRVFGSSVEATIAREGTSIASVDARDTSEESTQPSSSSDSSQPSTSSGRNAEPGSGYVKTGDSSLASDDETVDTSSPWGLVFIAVGVAAALVLLLNMLRPKPNSGD